jgi:cytosine/uracil/thiamine/allantoin permease
MLESVNYVLGMTCTNVQESTIPCGGLALSVLPCAAGVRAGAQLQAFIGLRLCAVILIV